MEFSNSSNQPHHNQNNSANHNSILPMNHGVTGHHQPSSVAEMELRTSIEPKPAKKLDPVAEKIASEMRVFEKVAEELTAKLNLQATFDDRCQQVANYATELFGVSPTWAAFYREVMGVQGVMRRMFVDQASMERYELSSHYGQILEMLTALRSRDLPENDPTEAQRMVTIRMPKSMYDVICAESNMLSISVNKLCISRITQRLDKAVVPKTIKKRRGRRPGSAGEVKQS